MLTSLYSDSTKGTLVGSVSTTGTVTFSDDYQFVGIRSSSGARYLLSIAFTWEAYDPTAPSISIDQPGSENEIGDTGTLTATTENAGGNTVSWESSAPSVISINSSTGAWTALKMGAATITATLGSTGKHSSIVMTVTGEITVAQARTAIDGLGGSDSPYRATVVGYVTSTSGDGTKNSNNSIYIADAIDGETTLQIFFGYSAVSNWETVSVKDTKIKAKGTMCLFSSSYELKNIVSVEAVDTDRGAVEDFVRDYMHMDYTDNLGYCNDNEHHYYLTAKAAFNDLTSTQQTLFRNDSEFSAAKARYEAWAVANNDAAPYDGNDTVVSTIHSNIIANVTNSDATISIMIVVIMLSASIVGGYFFLRRRKERN